LQAGLQAMEGEDSDEEEELDDNTDDADQEIIF
jgi:hypothetical protein